MAVSYKKLWKLMIDKDINKGKLCEAAEISAGTMAKMSKDEPVTLKVIERICDVLQCDIGDVVEKIPEQNEQQEGYK
ncbi:MAG: helix-turn-helix transcriptional regulator [Lachnospiraceae bacterium]|jgi:DNA-binding Xre family transcriptional regulator|nr:helix-turn-helix transcriptional regulator [Lachnospiraceae bacterium]